MDERLDYYRLSPDDVLAELDANAEGLHQNEAAERLDQYGPNALERVHKTPLPLTYLKQFKDLMILLLLGSSLLSFYLDDPRTGTVLLVLVFFNTTLGFLQEFKAGRVMDSLEKLVVSSAQVMRAGKHHEIPASQLVPGDIVFVEAGESVPADLRVMTEKELSTNDFALTGESNPARKFVHAIAGPVPLSGRQNLLFMGTTVATGNGLGIVIGTGAHTELGRIANLSQQTERADSPLQREMNNIAKKVTQGVIALCIVLLPLAINIGLPFEAALVFAVGFACSVIPNGLPAAISTSLARAAGKLVKAKALVKKLSAVEGLGATSVILTDKTGTLTKNQMTVERFLIGRTNYSVTGRGYEPEGEILDEKNEPLAALDIEKLMLFFTASALAGNAVISPPDDDHPEWYCLGDPTEGAAVTLATKAGLDVESAEKISPELHEFGFDSARKRMSSIRPYGAHEQLFLFVKGAPEAVLEKCDHIWDHGHIRPMQPADRHFLQSHNQKLAHDAMRNLGVAYRVLPKDTNPESIKLDEAENQLVWLGMLSMIDPLREEVPNAMDAARRAKIKVSIITGDYAPTAKAIALRARLTEQIDDIVTVSGEELESLSDTQVLALAERGGVIFSRVSPEDKLRIVGLVQDTGRVVAVTGDGINDAPALKRADIGVAMGVSGTDVSKQAAEIVLLDDSFSTLVGAVQEGRVIFANIKKAAMCSFTGNSAELFVNVFSLGAATLAGVPLALTVIQILAIDVIAELFPVAALGGDKADRDVMSEKPRDTKAHILNPRSLGDLVWTGLLIGGLTFANYMIFFARNGADPGSVASESALHLHATALTYVTLVLCLLANVLMRRSQQGLFTRYQLHNRSLWLAMLLSAFAVANIIYNPWLTDYFHTAPLDLLDWLTAAAVMAIFIAIQEFLRWSQKHSRRSVLELHQSTTH
jgi:Ca2+-transporting ATPase